jgi:hypothetical protein
MQIKKLTEDQVAAVRAQARRQMTSTAAIIVAKIGALPKADYIFALAAAIQEMVDQTAARGDGYDAEVDPILYEELAKECWERRAAMVRMTPAGKA